MLSSLRVAENFDEEQLAMLDVAGNVLEHAEARTRNALCPRNLTRFVASFDYNTFLFESDLEIYVTTCNVAANEKAYLEEYGFTSVTGLPEADHCLPEDMGMAQHLDRMSAQVIMRERLIYNHVGEPNIGITEMLLNS